MQEIEKKEKNGKIMGTICLCLAIFFILAAIAIIILGYFVSFRDNSGEIRDGFYRLLDEVPNGLSLILPQWAGYIWFILDCLALLGMVFLIDRLFVKSKIYFTGIKNVDF